MELFWHNKTNDRPAFFPSPELADEAGFLVEDARIDRERILDAYQHAIFPWPYREPESHWIVGWYSPDPRAVLKLDELRVPKRLVRKLRSGKFYFSFNQSFDRVLDHCRTVGGRQQEAWLMPRLAEELQGLHEEGTACSLEVYDATDSSTPELCGGVYGLSVGQVFCAESMFHLIPDASKAAIVALVSILRYSDYQLLDIQTPSMHMTNLGATLISRGELRRSLKSNSKRNELAKWESRDFFTWADIALDCRLPQAHQP
ncbi:MAG: leucyl/phenylalanyl-tRNA--protein transferase [Planctomycetota bacterium]|nr:leucyl/phenylalanyl-tRNA--protein transferase [Planctomycetota bacterium]